MPPQEATPEATAAARATEPRPTAHRLVASPQPTATMEPRRATVPRPAPTPRPALETARPPDPTHPPARDRKVRAASPPTRSRMATTSPASISEGRAATRSRTRTSPMPPDSAATRQAAQDRGPGTPPPARLAATPPAPHRLPTRVRPQATTPPPAASSPGRTTAAWRPLPRSPRCRRPREVPAARRADPRRRRRPRAPTPPATGAPLVTLAPPIPAQPTAPTRPPAASPSRPTPGTRMTLATRLRTPPRRHPEKRPTTLTSWQPPTAEPMPRSRPKDYRPSTNTATRPPPPTRSGTRVTPTPRHQRRPWCRIPTTSRDSICPTATAPPRPPRRTRPPRSTAPRPTPLTQTRPRSRLTTRPAPRRTRRRPRIRTTSTRQTAGTIPSTRSPNGTPTSRRTGPASGSGATVRCPPGHCTTPPGSPLICTRARALTRRGIPMMAPPTHSTRSATDSPNSGMAPPLWSPPIGPRAPTPEATRTSPTMTAATSRSPTRPRANPTRGHRRTATWATWPPDT